MERETVLDAFDVVHSLSHKNNLREDLLKTILYCKNKEYPLAKSIVMYL